MNLQLDMTELHFLAMHTGVVDIVLSRKAFKDILREFQSSRFCKERSAKNI